MCVRACMLPCVRFELNVLGSPILDVSPESNSSYAKTARALCVLVARKHDGRVNLKVLSVITIMSALSQNCPGFCAKKYSILTDREFRTLVQKPTGFRLSLIFQSVLLTCTENNGKQSERE